MLRILIALTKNALSDVVKGDADEIHTMVYDVFVKYFEENSEDFSTEAASELDKECDNVKFYVTDNTIVLYFDVYQVSLIPPMERECTPSSRGSSFGISH